MTFAERPVASVNGVSQSCGAMNLQPPINSLWQQTAAIEFLSNDLSDDVNCDVVVVGAGFTGLRAALELAQRGTDVVVIDAHDVGFGASGRSGGQVNPMLPVPHPDDLLHRVGATFAERMTEMSLQSADELFDLVEKHQIRCDARQHGWLRADHCDKARHTARAAATAWNTVGAGFSFVDGDEVGRLTGSPVYRSAVLAPKGGAVQPLSFVRGLARAAQQAGARIFRNAPAQSMQRDAGQWLLDVANRKIRASWIVMATNGYTDNAHRPLQRSILPLCPIQIATEPLTEEQIGPVLAEGHTISDTQRLIMYARREPGNQMVYGGIGYRLPFGGIGGFNWLLADVKRIFPSLAEVDWTYRWGGQIAITNDRLPHLHEPQPNLIAGLGYNGRGVAMSIVMGRILAARVLGTPAEALPIPVTQISSLPFRDTQVYGAGLAMSWMRLRDKLEFAAAASNSNRQG